MAKKTLGRIFPVPEGTYSASKTYKELSIVTYNGNSYICKKQSSGNEPTNTTYWQLMASKGEQGIQGIQGIQGVQGAKGDKGEPGEPGSSTTTTTTTAKKPAAKKATSTTAAKKPAAKKATTTKKAADDSKKKVTSSKTYHVSKRKDDGKWQVKFANGKKALKLFDTQAEAINFAEEKADNQDANITIHKVDGKIRKQDYSKKEEK